MKLPPEDDGDLSHEIAVQQRIVGDLNQTSLGGGFGWQHPCGIDRATGKPYTLIELYDRYALAMLVISEVTERAKHASPDPL